MPEFDFSSITKDILTVLVQFCRNLWVTAEDKKCGSVAIFKWTCGLRESCELWNVMPCCDLKTKDWVHLWPTDKVSRTTSRGLNAGLSLKAKSWSHQTPTTAIHCYITPLSNISLFPLFGLVNFLSWTNCLLLWSQNQALHSSQIPFCRSFVFVSIHHSVEIRLPMFWSRSQIHTAKFCSWSSIFNGSQPHIHCLMNWLKWSSPTAMLT